MQGRGDENACDPGLRERSKIGGTANAACGIDAEVDARVPLRNRFEAI